MTTPFGILPDETDFLATLSDEERLRHLEGVVDTTGIEGVSHQPVMDPKVLQRSHLLFLEARRRVHESAGI